MYDYYHRRSDLDLSDSKCKFLIWSSLDNHLIGYYWIKRAIEISENVEEHINEYAETQMNGNTIPYVERLLFALSEEEKLENLNSNNNGAKMKSEEFLSNFGSSPIEKTRIAEDLEPIEVSGESYAVEELISGGGSAEAVLDSLISELQAEDDNTIRLDLRKAEFALLSSIQK